MDLIINVTISCSMICFRIPQLRWVSHTYSYSYSFFSTQILFSIYVDYHVIGRYRKSVVTEAHGSCSKRTNKSIGRIGVEERKWIR